jgi:hypothetical protein
VPTQATEDKVKVFWKHSSRVVEERQPSSPSHAVGKRAVPEASPKIDFLVLVTFSASTASEASRMPLDFLDGRHTQ